MGRMNDDMLIVHICQEFGWTYEEYQSQPAYFLEIIRRKMKIDQKEQELSLKKLKRG